RHRAARSGHPGRSRHVGRRPDRGPQAPGALPQAGLAGTQITHAGRKGSTPRSFDKPGQLGPAGAGWQKWEVVGPSELSAADGWQIPRQLGTDEIAKLVQKFGEAAKRADAAGYDVI